MEQNYPSFASALSQGSVFHYAFYLLIIVWVIIHFLKLRKNFFWRGGPFLFLAFSFGLYCFSNYLLMQTLMLSGGMDPSFLFGSEYAINALTLFCIGLTLITFVLQLLSKPSAEQAGDLKPDHVSS